jgi:hypothetical protein
LISPVGRQMAKINKEETSQCECMKEWHKAHSTKYIRRLHARTAQNPNPFAAQIALGAVTARFCGLRIHFVRKHLLIFGTVLCVQTVRSTF